MNRAIRTRTTGTPPRERRQPVGEESVSEEVHLIKFEWATRSGKQTVVYLDRRRLD